MCGIAGFWDANNLELSTAASILRAMTDAITHRGPDDAGHWLGLDGGIGLGHRRLAIIDLSPSGHQPMSSNSQRYMVVYNGEIYNHLDLRKLLELDGNVNWRGHSDTETLLAGFDAWGIEETLRRSVGMFALAIWDNQQEELILARDRIGEKPLYYGWSNGNQDSVFIFASELKSLAQHPKFSREIDRSSLSLYVRHGYVPTPYSIFRGISKLSPGNLLRIKKNKSISITAYWRMTEVVEKGLSDPFIGSKEEAVNSLDGILKTAVLQQMASDVPLGAFLSGGVDSSTVVAIMQSQSKIPVKTFTIGFHEKNFNEAEHAKRVANHLGTDHTELYVNGDYALKLIPDLANFYDEPFSDSSQLPTLLVSQIARAHVTVALSGDGGDELFNGYDRYRWCSNIWEKLRSIPQPMRKIAGLGVRSVPPNIWNIGRPLLGRRMQGVNLGDKLHKAAALMSSEDAAQLYHRFVSLWDSPAELVIGAKEYDTWLTQTVPEFEHLDSMQRMMAIDTLSYLPDDILTKVDRAAMAMSLETRVPLLDHRVVEFSWKLPSQYKYHEKQMKWVLRQVLYKYVPRDLIERPKMGFAVPLANWLRGPLRPWAEELLAEQRLRKDGFFYPDVVRSRWQEHLAGTRNWEHQLWNILIFNMWFDKWMR